MVARNDLSRSIPRLTLNQAEATEALAVGLNTFKSHVRPHLKRVDIGGSTVPEGEKVLMFLASANRDPRRWENPDHYDITRRTSGHVGFGSGIHMCVGQLVARLEGEVLLAALARKVAAIEITGPVKRRFNNTLRGLDSLPVTFTAA